MSGDRGKANTLLTTALASLEAGNADAAVEATGQAIEIAPGYAVAIHVLGLAAMRMDSVLRADELFRIAHDTAPDVREHCEAVAIVSAQLGRLNDALFYGKMSPSLPRAAEIPGLLPAWLGTYEDAMRAMDRSDKVDAGLALMRDGRYVEAADEFRSGVETKSTDDRGWRGLRDCLIEMGQPYEALLAGQALASIRKSSFNDMSAVATILTSLGHFEEAQSCHIKAVQELPHDMAVRSALIADLYVSPAIDLEDIRKSERLWEISFQPPSEKLLSKSGGAGDSPVKVGLLSGRLKGLQGMEAVLPALTAQAGGGFTVHVYSNAVKDDALTRKVRGDVAGWTDIRPIDDATAARIIRNDDIDILIDMDGHTASGRMGVVGTKPARTVLSWFGITDPDATIHDGTIDAEGILFNTGDRIPFDPFCISSDVTITAKQRMDDAVPLRIGLSCLPRKISDEFLAVLVKLCESDETLRIVVNPVAIGGGPGLDDLEPRLDKAGILERLDYSEPTGTSIKTIDNFTGSVDLILDPGPDGDLQLTWETISNSCPIIVRSDGVPRNHAASALLRQYGLADMAVSDFDAMYATAASWIVERSKLSAAKENMAAQIREAVTAEKTKEIASGVARALRLAAGRPGR